MMLLRLITPVLALFVENPQEVLQGVDLAAYRGMTGFIAQTVLVVIIYIGAFIGSYGLAIILTAILVRLLLLQLTVSQIRTMRVQPYLTMLTKRIQQKYRGDKKAQNEKLMQLYSHFKMNPLSSCLAMVIQIPIFFGIYRALYDPVFLGRSFLGIQLLFPMNLYWIRSFTKGVDYEELLFDYIAQHNMWWQILQWKIHYGGHLYKWALYWPALALVVLYIATSIVMQKLMRNVTAPDPEAKALMESVEGKRKSAQQKGPDLSDQMQKQMKWMNILLILIAFILSAGALLYFVAQNMLMMLEYSLIPRVMKLSYSAAQINAVIEAVEKDKPARGERDVPPAGSPANPAGDADEDEEEAMQIMGARKPFKRK